MHVEVYDANGRREILFVENDARRAHEPHDVWRMATKKFPDATRLVVTGRNGFLLHEEYLRRGDGSWVDKYAPLPRENLGSAMLEVLRRVFSRKR